jgi:uncharacterized protein YggT (Ycf19 family)
MVVVVQLVNYALALLMWLIVGRAALGVLTGGRPSPVQAFFDRCTQPALSLTRKALPFVGEKWVPLAAIVILAALRLGLILAAHPAASR